MKVKATFIISDDNTLPLNQRLQRVFNWASAVIFEADLAKHVVQNKSGTCIGITIRESNGDKIGAVEVIGSNLNV